MYFSILGSRERGYKVDIHFYDVINSGECQLPRTVINSGECQLPRTVFGTKKNVILAISIAKVIAF